MYQGGPWPPFSQVASSVGTSEQNYVNVTYGKLVELAQKYSGGAFEFQLYPDMRLGDEQKTVRALQHGDIQMSVLATNNFMPFAPSCGWLNMPYLFGSLEEFRKLVDLMWGQHNAWAVKESGARVLAIVDIGYRQLTTDAAHPVRNLADARGLAVRTPQNALAVSAFNALGFKPHPASFADTYGMLAKGTVNGQEGCFNNVVTMKFADHQKYATCINYAVHSANIIVNEEWLQGLPEQARDALIRAGREAMAYERTKVSQMLVADDRALQEQGMELLGVVEDLSEWTRLGRTSWLKCYDVLGYGNADKGKAIMAVVLSKKEALANAWRTGSGSRPRRAEPFSSTPAKRHTKRSPRGSAFCAYGEMGSLMSCTPSHAVAAQGPVLGLSLALFQLRQGQDAAHGASGIRGCY
ncbi:MAG: TRAP transporter substrate-binding protein [Bilophila wadsworthia]